MLSLDEDSSENNLTNGFVKKSKLGLDKLNLSRGENFLCCQKVTCLDL